MFRRDIDAEFRRTHMAESARGVDDRATARLGHGGNLMLHRIEDAPDTDGGERALGSAAINPNAEMTLIALPGLPDKDLLVVPTGACARILKDLTKS
jgi:hypothetical protein